MRLTVEMTLTANTAKRLKETAERLAAHGLGDDGLLAAAILMRIATSYERAARERSGPKTPVAITPTMGKGNRPP